jgi:hypothetical protein
MRVEGTEIPLDAILVIHMWTMINYEVTSPLARPCWQICGKEWPTSNALSFVSKYIYKIRGPPKFLRYSPIIALIFLPPSTNSFFLHTCTVLYGSGCLTDHNERSLPATVMIFFIASYRRCSLVITELNQTMYNCLSADPHYRYHCLIWQSRYVSSIFSNAL